VRRGRKNDDDFVRALSQSYRKIFDVVVRIPRGRVMTYGQVARAAGLGGAARLAGYAMRALGERVPWQRVLGAKKKGIAQVTIRDPLIGSEQRRLLEREGVRFSLAGGVDLARYGHAPRRKTG